MTPELRDTELGRLFLAHEKSRDAWHDAIGLDDAMEAYDAARKARDAFLAKLEMAADLVRKDDEMKDGMAEAYAEQKHPYDCMCWGCRGDAK